MLFFITCLISLHFINEFHLYVFFFFFLSSLLQNGCFGDADIDRLKLADSYINGTQVQVDAETLSTCFPVFIRIGVIDCLCSEFATVQNG